MCCRYCNENKHEALIKDNDSTEYHQSCHEKFEEEYSLWLWEREQEFFNMLESGEIEFIQQENRK